MLMGFCSTLNSIISWARPFSTQLSISVHAEGSKESGQFLEHEQIKNFLLPQVSPRVPRPHEYRVWPARLYSSTKWKCAGLN